MPNKVKRSNIWDLSVTRELKRKKAMLKLEDLARKREIVIRFVREMDLYYRTFNKPFPMRIASAKYFKALRDLGGFHQTLEELELDGTIQIERLESGNRLIYPSVVRRHTTLSA
jgi:hypothetical protein